jgi:hypothetical protein
VSDVLSDAAHRAAARLRETHWDGSGCGTHGTNACSRCFGPSPASADEVAREVLEAARYAELVADAVRLRLDLADAETDRHHFREVATKAKDERDAALTEAERVRALHHDDGTGWCIEDSFSWPCRTARILRDET